MPSKTKTPGAAPVAEALEARRMMDAVATNVDISRASTNQSEGAIAIDRVDPSHVFAVSNIEFGEGIRVGVSDDGGAHWTTRTVADGSDGLPKACCDPSAAYDSFGNLFLGYLNTDFSRAVVAVSTDQGRTFSTLASLPASDQPTVTAGPGSVWVTFQKGSQVFAAGAADNGLGGVGAFGAAQVIPGSAGGNFGDIAIGPAGQVVVAYQKGAGTIDKIFVSVDRDGLGAGKFGKAFAATTTRVGGFDLVPEQVSRGVDAEASLGFDRSGGPFTGRLYMAYTDEVPAHSGNTDTLLRYSDNGGITWSSPARVNDDTGFNGQILPRLAVDDTTGEVAVSWHDSRLDLGAGSAGDTDGVVNTDVELFAALVTPTATGLLISPNVQVSAGATNAKSSDNNIDLGDYTGLDYFAGTLMPVWADNSNSTGDNPDGAHKDLDLYTASVSTSVFPATTAVSLGGLPASRPFSNLVPGPQQSAGLVLNGRSFTFSVTYTDPGGIDLSSVKSSTIAVAGPNGFAATVAAAKVKSTRRGTVVTATYTVAAPAGAWRAVDDGTYTLSLPAGAVRDLAGTAAPDGILGYFVVDLGGVRHGPRPTGPRHRDEGDAD